MIGMAKNRVLSLLSADNVTVPTARLVGLLCGNHDRRVIVACRFSVDESLAARRRLPTLGTDRLEFVDVLRERHKLCKRLERFGAKRLICPTDDDPVTVVSEAFTDRNQFCGKEVRFIEGNNLLAVK